jgi:hypothetical protein
MALNWSGAGTGALTGAGAGAAFGPWGAAAGGVLGGALGLFGGDGSSPDKLKKIGTQTKEQEALHNSILAQAMGMSQQGGGYQNAQNYYNSFLGDNQQQAFNNFSAPYMQQFQEQMLPQIAERFAGAGALSSSGFGQSLGGAASGLQAQLAKLFSDLQGQAAQQQYGQYNQLAQTGLGHEQFAYNRQQGSAGFLQPFAAGMAGEVGKPIGSAIGKGIADLFKPKAAPGTTGGIT